MNLQRLLSLECHSDPYGKEVFAKRTEAFFAYSGSNIKALLFGLVVIAATLSLMKTPALAVGLWLGFGATLGGLLIALTWRYGNHDALTQAQRKLYIQWRIIIGACIALMYGVAAFLLPDAATHDGALYLTIVTLVVGAIAILQYSFLPAYYVLFNLSMALPLTLYLATHLQHDHAWTLFFLVTAMAILLLKGMHVSKHAYDAVLFNLRLEKEVQEHIHTKQQLEAMALNDHLTGLANRRLFEQSMAQGLTQCQRSGKPLSVLFIDLNDFKGINDAYGHEIGDKVLQEAAQRIKDGVRKSDLVARLGGDEFAVLLLDCQLNDCQHPFIQSLVARLNQPLEIDGLKLPLSASMGRACYPNDGLDHTKLMQTADRRMYEHKTQCKQAKAANMA